MSASRALLELLTESDYEWLRSEAALLPHASTQGELRRLERAIAVLTSDEDEDERPAR